MNCPGDFEWNLFLDSELPPARKEEMKGHLDGCRDCTRLVAGLRREADLIGASLAGIPLPPNLAAFIGHRLNSQNETETRWLFMLIPAAVLTGIFIASAAGLWNLLENVLSFIKLLAGGTLISETVLLMAGLLRQAAGASLNGELALPALVVMVFCLTWIKFKIRKGGHAHA
ncbi:MAG: zf-HC2 domain-containing protein [Firmicutes bacterium]|nr:zf-HC2 domain-containing protein [Bacillota bacterium]MCL5057439.1 zf-HC2 domain-containing protein [Actinomycetota bacterium]